MGKQQEKKNFIDATLNYYKSLQNRFNNGYDYIENMAKNHTVEEIDNSKEYKAYQAIIKELSTLEDMINQYSIFECIKEQIK